MNISFGTDGIRGVANRELTAEDALRVGRALARDLRGGTAGRPLAVIGRDTRLSGDMLQGALTAGLCSLGVDVAHAGVIPTGGLAWLTRELQAAAGVMISASHNPIEDNGIKIFGSDGFKLDEGREAELERTANGPRETRDLPTGAAVGRARSVEGERERYAEWARSLLEGARIDGAIVVDAAHGAASPIVRAVFDGCARQVECLNDAGDGSRINVDCGSTRPEAAGIAVRESGAVLGLAFDGDADRVLMLDETGAVVDGDQLMLLFAADMLRSGSLPGRTVVATVMSNMGFEKALHDLGARMVRAPVGDKYVMNEMRKGGHMLGGEQSGHIIRLDRATTGDGLVTAALALRVIAESGRPLSELAAIRRSAQFLKNLRVKQKEKFHGNAAIGAKVDEVTGRLGPNGRVVVRPSGTEPLIRVMVEAWDARQAEACTDEILQTIREELGAGA